MVLGQLRKLSCIFLLSSLCMCVPPNANDDNEKEKREREESGKGEGNSFLKKEGRINEKQQESSLKRKESWNIKV